jgi:hypothetical protein
VDDGSTDRTGALIESIARRDGRFRPLRLRRNSGQTLALAAGFQAARGAIVVSMDGDLQNDPADIPRLVAGIEAGADVVCGWRRRRQDPTLLRKIPSAIANRMIVAVTGVAIHDTGCTLRAYRAEVVKALTMYSDMHRFLPALTSMTGARVVELEVNHRARQFGVSKYGIGRTFRVMADVVSISMLVRFGPTPGRWFGLLSLPPLAVGLLCASVALANPEPGQVVLWSLTVMMFYLASHMVTLAIMAEMFLYSSDRGPLRRLQRSLLLVEDSTRSECSGVRS